MSPEPTVAAPAPAPEKAAPEPAPAQEERASASQDLPRLTGELVERARSSGTSTRISSAREDGGAELTEADNQLKDEMDALSAAADRFNKRVNERFFVRAWDRLKRQDQQEAIRRRSQDVAGAVGRIDRLMAQVQPSPDVRQEWQEVRRRWTRLAQVSGRGKSAPEQRHRRSDRRAAEERRDHPQLEPEEREGRRDRQQQGEVEDTPIRRQQTRSEGADLTHPAEQGMEGNQTARFRITPTTAAVTPAGRR